MASDTKPYAANRGEISSPADNAITNSKLGGELNTKSADSGSIPINHNKHIEFGSAGGGTTISTPADPITKGSVP